MAGTAAERATRRFGAGEAFGSPACRRRGSESPGDFAETASVRPVPFGTFAAIVGRPAG